MDIEGIGGIDTDTTTQEILLAATNHDLAALKPFLRTPGAASVQDPETGLTPLHAAISACGPAQGVQDFTEFPGSKEESESKEGKDGEAKPALNGHNEKQLEHAQAELKDENEEEVDLKVAMETVRELFLAGAIWNDLDINDETPGCLAWRLGQKDLYELVVEAGVRAEILMNLMGGYEELESGRDEEEDEAQEEDGELEITPTALNGAEALEQATSEYTAPEIAAAITMAVESEEPSEPAPTKDVNSADYLASNLTYTSTTLLDSSANGVMMSWETPIMELTASLLAPSPGLRILNIGFGMGIIDRLFSATKPSSHHIVEAHPSVLSALSKDDSALGFGPSWVKEGEGKNVIHAGKWQEVIPKLIEEGEIFDVIYFDTFGESYSQLKMFFTEYVVALLDESGRFSFFNGLGADRRVCYDVYCRVAELDLCDAGFDTEWKEFAVQELGDEGTGEWEGVMRRYWTLDKYRLPICTFMG